MTLREKLEIYKEKGWKYNKDTGEVFSHTGKVIKGENSNGYVYCSLQINGKRISVKGHQLAWYLSTGKVPLIIDHINRKRNDNRLINLRDTTNQKNMFNTDAKGYYWNKNNKCQAYINLNSKQISLGHFANETDAHNAYLEAKKIYHRI